MRIGKTLSSIVQVLAKLSRADGTFEVLIGGGHDAHIHLDRLSGADRLHLSVLKDPEELGLCVLRQVADLVQEYGTVVRDFELAGLPGNGSSKGALFVAEQLTLDQRFRKGGAVDGHERRLTSGAPVVNVSCEEFLPAARLSKQEDGGIARRRQRRLPYRFFQRGAPTDNLVVASGEPDVLFEMADMAAQTVLLLEQRPQTLAILLAGAVKACIGDRNRRLCGQGFESCDVGLSRRALGVEACRVQADDAEGLAVRHEWNHEHRSQGRAMNQGRIEPPVVVFHVGNEDDLSLRKRQTNDARIGSEGEVAKHLAAWSSRADGTQPFDAAVVQENPTRGRRKHVLDSIQDCGAHSREVEMRRQRTRGLDQRLFNGLRPMLPRCRAQRLRRHAATHVTIQV